jgi:hypothetical protein
MRFKLIDAAKKEFPVQRLCKVLGVTQAATSPGETARPAFASARTWCSWRMSARPSSSRTEPTEARA